MRPRGTLKSDADADAAAYEALRGVAVGAARWSAPSILLSGLGQIMSPIYRGLTIQFKIFLVMSGMIMGGWIEGDRRLRHYEEMIRAKRQMKRHEIAFRDIEIKEEMARMLAKERNEAASAKASEDAEPKMPRSERDAG